MRKYNNINLKFSIGLILLLIDPFRYSFIINRLGNKFSSYLTLHSDDRIKYHKKKIEKKKFVFSEKAKIFM